MNTIRCQDCSVVVERTGRNQIRCPDCARDARIARSRRYYDLYYRTGQGSGGNQRGARNHQWADGVSPEAYREAKLSTGIVRCEQCDKDLSDVIRTAVGRGYWTVHHRDGNSLNRELSNLELLCKSCHQREHECWRNFNVKV